MFPVLVGHADALELAIDHALPAVDTAVHVVGDHILLCGAVQDDQLKGLRRAILDAQAAARAGRGCIGEDAPVTFRGRGPFERIQLRIVFLEERLEDIPEHGAKSHRPPPFKTIVSRIWARTRMLPKRHHRPTVWSIRRRVSSVWKMDIRNRTARVFPRKGSTPCKPPR